MASEANPLVFQFISHVDHTHNINRCKGNIHVDVYVPIIILYAHRIMNESHSELQ